MNVLEHGRLMKVIFKAGEDGEPQKWSFGSAAAMDITGINNESSLCKVNDTTTNFAALVRTSYHQGKTTHGLLSYRKTADKMSGDLANLGALIAAQYCHYG